MTGQISLVHVRWSYYQSKEVSIQVKSSNEPVLERPITDDVPEVPEYPRTPEGFIWEATGWTNCTEKCGGGMYVMMDHVDWTLVSNVQIQTGL